MTPEDLMYRRSDLPEPTTFEDLIMFWRAARDEARTVTLETAGIVASKVSSAAVSVAVKAAELGAEWRGRADALAPSLPVPDYWVDADEDLADTSDLDLHAQAEREAAMARHPSSTESP